MGDTMQHNSREFNKNIALEQALAIENDSHYN